MNILLLGSGGREHALAWKISSSPLCKQLYVAPGNAGTALCGNNVQLDMKDTQALADFALSADIGMVVVGPEDPLVNGLADYFRGHGRLRHILFVGPGAAGAKLEGSKAFAKGFMQRHQIPTAAYETFTKDTLEEGLAFIDRLQPPYVLKADGLAAGKGVIICSSKDEAHKVLNEMLCHSMFGKASNTVVIEEFLDGRELSAFVITDGNTYRMLPAAKDYKRVGEKDTGANTGGMGAVSPVPFAGRMLTDRIEERIIKPTIDGLKREMISYCGFLFFGLMVVDDNPYVIEYNVRLGDPEAEGILPRMDFDVVEMMRAACVSGLHAVNADISPRHALTVVLASGGYPGEYRKGFEINNTDKVDGSQLFYSGVKQENDRLLTNGGRVMAVTSLAATLEEAMDITYNNAMVIDFKGKYYRRDIGRDLL